MHGGAGSFPVLAGRRPAAGSGVPGLSAEPVGTAAAWVIRCCGLPFDGSLPMRDAGRVSLDEITDLDLEHVLAFGYHPDFPWLRPPNPN